MMINRRLVQTTLSVLLAACGTSATTTTEDQATTTTAPPEAVEMTLSSPDVDSLGRIPEWAANSMGGMCDGENRSVALEWTGIPAGTESLVLTMTDPANPSFVHWVVTGIPADVTGLPSSPSGEIGVGVTGFSFRGSAVYAGPCLLNNPYLLTLHAVGTEIEGTSNTTAKQLEEMISGHVLATAKLTLLRSDPNAKFTLTSPDLDADGYLPEWSVATVNRECTGENSSPRLEWANPPIGTQSYLITMVNPAAIAFPHWVLSDIPADVTSLPKAKDGEVGVGVTGFSLQGSGRYVGTCRIDNTYRFTIYALDTTTDGNSNTTYNTALRKIEGHVLAEASLDTMTPPPSSAD